MPPRDAPGDAVKAETPAAPRKQRIVFAQSRAAAHQEEARRAGGRRSDTVGVKRLLALAGACLAAMAAGYLALPPLCPPGAETQHGVRGAACALLRSLPPLRVPRLCGSLPESGIRRRLCDLYSGIVGLGVPKMAEDKPQQKEEAVSYAGRLTMHAAGFCIHKDASKGGNMCGEDAFRVEMAQDAPRAGRSFIAVADGVGGWSESGGDSSKVSSGILAHMAQAVAGASDAAAFDLAQLGAEAFARMRAAGGFSRGSTTVCAAALDHATGRLLVANVGDSGLLVVRGGSVVFRTRPGLEGFNTPHQVGFDEAGNAYGSFLGMASRSALPLVPGDIVIAVSDGVLDNLFEDEIPAIVCAALGPLGDSSAVASGAALRRVVRADTRAAAIEERLSSAATALVMAAYARAKEMLWRSPFAETAMAHGYFFSGGKQDDISAVVALVVAS